MAKQSYLVLADRARDPELKGLFDAARWPLVMRFHDEVGWDGIDGVRYEWIDTQLRQTSSDSVHIEADEDTATIKVRIVEETQAAH